MSLMHRSVQASVQNQNPSPIVSKTPTVPNNFSTRLTQTMKKFTVPSSIYILGGMMFLINTSYVVIFSLTSIYLNSALGVSTVWIGLLEGVAEAISCLMKLFCGMVSDYLRKRKVLIVLGYVFTVFSKPLLALSNNFVLVFISRICERIGNGIQAAPRDAMVGDIAPAGNRGASYGMMRSLATAGSCLGGVLGYFAMIYTNSNFQQVFWIATVPAFMAFCILIFCVKEPKHNVPENAPARRPIKLEDLKLLGRPYWTLMAIVAIFMLARVSETFMVLHAHNSFGLEKIYVPLIMSMYNVTYSLSSFPSGWLSDKFGRRGVMIFGIAMLILADYCLASATSLYGVFLGVVIWGIQLGISQNVLVALITDYVPEDLRGTAIGFYHLIGAIAALIAGLFAGNLSHHYGITVTFTYSMCVAIIALLALLFFMPRTKKQ